MGDDEVLVAVCCGEEGAGVVGGDGGALELGGCEVV